MKLSKHENYSSQNSQSNFLPVQNKIIKFEHIKIKITSNHWIHICPTHQTLYHKNSILN